MGKRGEPAIWVSTNLNAGFQFSNFFIQACLAIQACKLELIRIKLKDQAALCTVCISFALDPTNFSRVLFRIFPKHDIGAYLKGFCFCLVFFFPFNFFVFLF